VENLVLISNQQCLLVEGIGARRKNHEAYPPFGTPDAIRHRRPASRVLTGLDRSRSHHHETPQKITGLRHKRNDWR
jgi:hypothetical protein